MDASTTKRLALIRYFYTIGIGQSHKPEPMSSVSILSFHDSIELFLQLGSEHLNAGSNKPNFMDYWDLLSAKTASPVTQKESMRRLNKSRVALKHHGTLPSRLDIESFRATVTAFFDENTKLIFGIDFNSISLIDLVACDKARRSLEQAQQKMDQGDLLECLDDCAIAFSELVSDYENRKRKRFGKSPFFFGREMTFLTSFFMKIEGDLGRFIDQVKESIESMQSAMRVLSLGLDYRKFTKFNLSTPIIYYTTAGRRLQRTARDNDPTVEECSFCIDFVIASALELQETDYTIAS